MLDKLKVLVTRVIPKAGLDLVRDACDADIWSNRKPLPRDVLLERVRGVSGLLSLFTDTVDAELLDAAGPGLKVVSNFAVGYDNIDVAATTARGIPVGNTPGVLTGTTADLAFALLMAVARRIVEGAEYVKAGEWGAWRKNMRLGYDVHGATLGIIGMGRIGQAVARRAPALTCGSLSLTPTAILRRRHSPAQGCAAAWMSCSPGQISSACTCPSVRIRVT